MDHSQANGQQTSQTKAPSEQLQDYVEDHSLVELLVCNSCKQSDIILHVWATWIDMI